MKTKLISIAATLLLAASSFSAFADNWMGNSTIIINKDWYVNSEWNNDDDQHNHVGSVSFLSISAETQVWFDGDVNLENQGSAELYYKIDGDDSAIKSLPLIWYGYHVSGSNNNGFKLDTPKYFDISGLTDGDHTIEFWFKCTYNGSEVYDSKNNSNYKVRFYKVPSLKDSENNDTWFASHPNWVVDIEISGRKLYKDGYWNTICLPFGLSDFTGTIFDGADVRTLETSSIADGTLTLNFSQESVSSITAGVPYIVKWENTQDIITDPIFYNVQVTKSTSGQAGSGDVIFRGCFNPFEFSGKEFLYLGEENTLYYSENPVTIGAFRAYFDLNPNAAKSGIKAFRMNFGDEEIVTSIKQIDANATATETWFTLDGRRINGKPATAGLYIHNGKKVVIK